MRRFNFYLPEELFERIKLMSNFYNIPISKMIIELIEISYLGVLKTEGYEHK